jgi:hypothetical protein
VFSSHCSQLPPEEGEIGKCANASDRTTVFIVRFEFGAARSQLIYTKRVSKIKINPIGENFSRDRCIYEGSEREATRLTRIPRLCGEEQRLLANSGYNVRYESRTIMQNNN